MATDLKQIFNKISSYSIMVFNDASRVQIENKENIPKCAKVTHYCYNSIYHLWLCLCPSAWPPCHALQTQVSTSIKRFCREIISRLVCRPPLTVESENCTGKSFPSWWKRKSVYQACKHSETTRIQNYLRIRIKDNTAFICVFKVESMNVQSIRAYIFSN